jgi:hypothetical protein
MGVCCDSDLYDREFHVEILLCCGESPMSCVLVVTVPKQLYCAHVSVQVPTANHQPFVETTV